MDSELTAFEYDDFEQYLLDAAAIDQAPTDLPTRLGVALGLGVPILAATQVASLVPTTTSLHGSLAVGGSVAPTGLFGTLKASLGVGAATLWGTAVKGIAVGLIAGTGLIGTGRALSSLAAAEAPPTTARLADSKPDSQARKAGLEQVQAVAAANDPEAGVAVNRADPVMDAEPVQRTVTRSQFGATTFSERSQTEAEQPEKPKRRANWKFPEKTYAVARYPILWDDVSAYYDTPKKQQLPSVATFDNEPNIAPAEVQALRVKAIQRCRMLLGQSKAAAALSELDQYRLQVGPRNFGVDELLLRIESLAVLGRAKEAQVDVANIARMAPNSAALRQAQQLANSRFVR